MALKFNIMHLHKLIIGAFIAIISLAGCSKYLDRPQENTANLSSIDYTDLGAMYAPVSGVYRSAASASPGFVHWIDFAIRGVRGDDLDKGGSSGDQSQLNNIKYFTYSAGSISTFWGSNNCWLDYYGLIINCNSALSELDKFKTNITESDAAHIAQYNQFRSEVRFIKAFSELIVSRVFGDVPILTDNNTLDVVGKSSVDDIRKFIITEMDTCENYLEDAVPVSASHVGAVTKYTALLLKAKAAADIAGSDNGSAYWDTVLNCTNRIISSGKFALYPDFYQLFKRPGKMSTESLYELQFTDFGTSAGTTVLPDAFWAFQGPGGDQHGSPISGWGFATPSDAIVGFFADRNDSVRAKTTILNVGATGSTYATTPSGDNIYGNSIGLKYFNGKAYLPVSQMTAGRTDYGSDNNVRVLRYADVLLLNAEAKIRKGQNGDEQLNLVRQRAKLNPITGATLQNVLDERRAEFACEWWGERYNDLVRTGQATSVLASFGYTTANTYLPIPQTQVDLNKNLQ